MKKLISENVSLAVANTKGSVGKTPISLSLAYDLNKNIITNDISALMLCFKQRTQLVQNFDYTKNIVYDMGGFKASSVLNIIEKVEKVIVPMNDDPSCFVHTLTCLKQWKDKAKEIIIIITKTDTHKEYLSIKNKIKNKFSDYDFKFFNLPERRKLFKKSLNTGKSIKYLVDNSKQFKNWHGAYVEKYYLPILKEVSK